jgi:putative addiction module component (TIGR02574 family)
MTQPPERIEAEALKLPRSERARLAEALIASLDEEAEIDEAWRQEIARRVEDLRSGSVAVVPSEEVFEALDDLTR